MEVLLGMGLNKEGRKEVVEKMATILANEINQEEEDYIVFSSLGMDPKLVNSIEMCLLYKHNIKCLTVPESEHIRVCISNTCSNNRRNGILKQVRANAPEMAKDAERVYKEVMEKAIRRIEEISFIANVVYSILGEVFSGADDE